MGRATQQLSGPSAAGEAPDPARDWLREGVLGVLGVLGPSQRAAAMALDGRRARGTEGKGTRKKRRAKAISWTLTRPALCRAGLAGTPASSRPFVLRPHRLSRRSLFAWPAASPGTKWIARPVPITGCGRPQLPESAAFALKPVDSASALPPPSRRPHRWKGCVVGGRDADRPGRAAPSGPAARFFQYSDGDVAAVDDYEISCMRSSSAEDRRADPSIERVAHLPQKTR
jgi:hypothetical protein